MSEPMIVRLSRFAIILFLLIEVHSLSAQHHRELPERLIYKEGEINHVSIREVLSLKMDFAQVDSELALPSVRTTDYAFTQTYDKVYPDGSVDVSMVLDSFKTMITLGRGPKAETFFQFNSADSYDMKNYFQDIRVLPRAQFLGNTLNYTLNSDGTVRSFKNLRGFYEAAIGKGLDYDLSHAMISLADSLRIGQLVEHSFGAVAAMANDNRKCIGPYTITEIPVQRVVMVSDVKKDTFYFVSNYMRAAEKVDYLEGIATPLKLSDFEGKGSGSIVMKSGKILSGNFKESARLKLHVDPEIVPEQIEREVTFTQTPVEVLRGGKVTIDIKEEHQGDSTPKLQLDPDTKVIEINKK